MGEQTSAENVQPGTGTKCLLSKFLTEGLFPYGIGYCKAQLKLFESISDL
jgi:hypothetical protein